MKRLAIVTSHPIQYYAPIFRELARRVDLQVFFAHRATPDQQAKAGFGTAFEWDVDLLSGYPHSFLQNVAREPSAQTFSGCDTPKVAEYIASGGYDAVLVTGWHLKCYWQTVLACKRHGIPVLVRGDSQLGTPRSVLRKIAKGLTYPLLLRLFDAVLYVGARNKAYLDHYRYPADRMFHSPHCVDTKWFAQRAGRGPRASLRQELGLSDRDVNVLFAGKLVPFKRPLDVVGAAAAARSDWPLHVTVAGSGELEAQLIARARDLGVPLHFLGFCNQSRMPQVYASSDFLVLPSTGRETWGLVCNEALACGVPVIVSDAVGCAEDFASGGAGRCYRMGDVSALAAAISDMIDHPSRPEEVRALSDRYSVAAACQGIEEALAHVGGRRTREQGVQS